MSDHYVTSSHFVLLYIRGLKLLCVFVETFKVIVSFCLFYTEGVLRLSHVDLLQ